MQPSSCTADRNLPVLSDAIEYHGPWGAVALAQAPPMLVHVQIQPPFCTAARFAPVESDAIEYHADGLGADDKVQSTPFVEIQIPPPLTTAAKTLPDDDGNDIPDDEDAIEYQFILDGAVVIDHVSPPIENNNSNDSDDDVDIDDDT